MRRGRRTWEMVADGRNDDAKQIGQGNNGPPREEGGATALDKQCIFRKQIARGGSMTRLLHQPNSGLSAGDELLAALGDEKWTRFDGAVAFAKRSGVAQISEALQKFADRTGAIRLTVGIDARGTTREGLETLLEALGGRARVFHNAATNPHPSFHPKVFLFSSDTSALLIVGSSNLTFGGLFSNHEASMVIELNLKRDEDAMAFKQVIDMLSMWYDDAALTRELSNELILELSAAEMLGTESGAAPQAVEAEPDEATAAPRVAAALFGADPARGLPRIPHRAASTVQTPAPQLAAATPPPLTVSWSKVLSATDAQHPPRVGSNPTGNLRLVKAGHDINHRTFFRRELFGHLIWTVSADSRGNSIELAEASVEVTVNGNNYGQVTFIIDHAPHREAGQDNHTTVLHWGDFTGVLTQTNLTDRTLVIENRTGDLYLQIS